MNHISLNYNSYSLADMLLLLKEVLPKQKHPVIPQPRWPNWNWSISYEISPITNHNSDWAKDGF
jgi:hypothetical protein